MSRAPRWIARLQAFVMGYFWAPCPLCGEPFAGFESGHIGTLDGRIVCNKPACVAEAESAWRVRQQAWIDSMKSEPSDG